FTSRSRFRGWTSSDWPTLLCQLHRPAFYPRREIERRRVRKIFIALSVARRQESIVAFLSRPHNKPPSVAAMRVNNPDRSPARIHCRDVAITPTGFLEIVSDDFPGLQSTRLLLLICSRPFSVLVYSLQAVALTFCTPAVSGFDLLLLARRT